MYPEPFINLHNLKLKIIQTKVLNHIKSKTKPCPNLTYLSLYPYLHLSHPWDLLKDGDIEANPGPKKGLTLGTVNVRSCSKYTKLKPLLNHISQFRIGERVVYSLQETYITKPVMLTTMWHGGFVLAPGSTKSRGVVTLYTEKTFDNVLYTHGSEDGRRTIIVGSFGETTDLVMSIYAPSSGKNSLFFLACFKAIDDLVEKYDVDNIYLMGDFNLPLATSANLNRKITNTELDIISECRNWMESRNLVDSYEDANTRYTWRRGDTFSTLDYIICPLGNLNKVQSRKIRWGFGGDHAALEITFKPERNTGKGLFRPNLAFLDYPIPREQFITDYNEIVSSAPTTWDPHTTLEFHKVAIRTAINRVTKDFRLTLNVNIEAARITYGKLIKMRADCTKRVIEGGYYDAEKIDSIDTQIFKTEVKINKLLEKKAKVLATGARIKWLEMGERSNKYFLNLTNSYHGQAYFERFSDGINTTTSNPDKVKLAGNYYKELYSQVINSDPQELDDVVHIHDKLSEKLSNDLEKPLTTEELTNVLKKCGDTAAGPDGISFKIYKAIWGTFAKVLLDSWNHSVKIGDLSPSQKDSVICLLEKKGKDKTLIKNLRPITLSNCDLKIITKALTKRCSEALKLVIYPTQAAYIPGRSVHDNLRSIDMYKDICHKHDNEAFLIALDAAKAFDSVDHDFIRWVLRKFGFPESFIHSFNILYRDIRSRVMVNGFLSEDFKISRGVKQGDALSCVLFILVMDIVIRMITGSPELKSLHISAEAAAPRVIAYADDIAVIVKQPTEINKIISIYGEFSKYSGLKLNVDKTEILRLNGFRQMDIDTNGQSIPLSDHLTICGRAFSNDPAIEYKLNITDKIEKMNSALKTWNRRNLSIFGRNLVLKTFGISQLTYSLQNQAISSEDMVKVERMWFSFIWNKKADKKHAFERVSRLKMKLPNKCGGIAAPDIKTFDLGLKVKQVIRVGSDSKHWLNGLQGYLYGGNLALINKITNNKFLDTAAGGLKSYTLNLINEINNTPTETKLRNEYYDITATLGVNDALALSGNNQILSCSAAGIRRRFGVKTINDLINEFRYPRCDASFELANQLISSNKLLQTLARRNKISQIDPLGSFILQSNKVTKVENLTTKALKTHFQYGLMIPEFNQKFSHLKFIEHPKEKETEFFILHDVVLSGSKLFSMKFRDTDKCKQCQITQDTEHIFKKCKNAINAQAALDELSDQIPGNLLVNFKSLINRTLFSKKDSNTNSEIYTYILKNRLNDLMAINTNRSNVKILKNIKKGNLTT